jgi:hypothetical protein
MFASKSPNVHVKLNHGFSQKFLQLHRKPDDPTSQKVQVWSQIPIPDSLKSAKEQPDF